MPGVPLASLKKARERWFSFRFSRLRWPEWVVAISALVLLVALFSMTWFTYSTTPGGLGPNNIVPYSVNGWHGISHGRWLLLITAVAGLTLFLLQLARPTPTLPVTTSVVLIYLGALSVFWLVFRV